MKISEITGSPASPVSAGMEQKVYVIILNWNGWPDTLECLESVFRTGHRPFQVVVCDNGSTNGSLDRIRDWAEGRLSVHTQADNPLRQFSSPPISKPIQYVEYPRTAAEQGGDERAAGAALVLIDTGENLGFAGGNNVGLRYAMARGDMNFAWLLNNDTVVRPETLGLMVEKLRENPSAGLCGSMLAYYSQPQTIQAAGGFEYNRWFGLSRLIEQFSPLPEDPSLMESRVERRMFGVLGASILATAPFLKRVGLLSESYFLYFEEQDWAQRARQNGFSMVFCGRSIVYHKEGASTGASGMDVGGKSELSDYYSVRSRVVFTRQFFAYALPTVYLSLLGTVVNRIRRGQSRRIPLIVRAALSGLTSSVSR
jgi:GT2 family glycosyltransferase